MISLDDYNREKIEKYTFIESKMGNGIACPRCKGEMKDINPGYVLCSNPPRVAVECLTCGFSSSRID